MRWREEIAVERLRARRFLAQKAALRNAASGGYRVIGSIDRTM
jgi:hypothetical protein